MSTSPLFWLRPLFICLTSQLYLWEYIWSSQQILISLFGFLQIKAHSSKFNLVFRSHSVLESLRKFGLALNLWKWQCSEGVVWFGFNELFLSLFPDNSWCPWQFFYECIIINLDNDFHLKVCNISTLHWRNWRAKIKDTFHQSSSAQNLGRKDS